MSCRSGKSIALASTSAWFALGGALTQTIVEESPEAGIENRDVFDEITVTALTL